MIKLQNVDFQMSQKYLLMKFTFYIARILIFGLLIFFRTEKMSISFNLGDYKLTCEIQQSRLLMRMEPLKVEDRNVVHYLYQAEYRDPHLPEGIKLLFNESTSDWYRYIEFYLEKCFELNHQMLRKDQQSEPNVQIQYIQLPLIFKLKVMEGIKESRFKLYGEKELFSKEIKLQRLLTAKENEVQDLKKSLNQKNQLIQELKLKITKFNQQNEELRQENSRLIQNQLPRKKAHYNQEHEQGAMSQQNNDFYYLPNQQSNSSKKSKSSQKRNTQTYQTPAQNISIQNQPSLSNPAFSEINQQNDLNQRRMNQIPQMKSGQYSDKHSETFYNRPNINQKSENGTSSFSNQIKTTNANSLSANFQNRRQIQEERKDDKLIQNGHLHQNGVSNKPILIIQTPTQSQPQIQKPPVSIQKQSLQPVQVQSNPHPQIIALNGQVFSDEKIRMIKQFASKRCHLEVGFDDNNQIKYGYCCVFCQKVFKQEQFLSKHLFSRHPEINNETTIDYLIGVLNHFKRRREQRILTIEANLATQRRLANRAQLLQGRQ